MIRAGVALTDITPPPGLAMSGFVARTQTAIGAHDPLTVRAIAVNDTALMVADVIGIDAAMSARIRARCCLPDDRVIVTATHTHGGPVSMAGRLWADADQDYLQKLEDACVTAIDEAVRRQQPAQLSFGMGRDPDVARNRRHPSGLTDRALPVLRIRAASGKLLAVLVAYACHPVVLAADNLLFTADFPHFLRKTIEEAHPEAIAVFATGCTGDANTGHAAHASITLTANPDRSFDAAERIGSKIAQAALAAPEHLLPKTVRVENRTVALALARREAQSLPELAALWRRDAETADPVRQALLTCWADWAVQAEITPLNPISARVTALNWGGIPLLGLPGEIFASTGTILRGHCLKGEAFVLGFADDNPGYIPPYEEYGFGGYEVDEAHRYYGMPAGFAPGSAETLAHAAIDMLDALKRTS